jgi:uncharacterized protein YkwD
VPDPGLVTPLTAVVALALPAPADPVDLTSASGCADADAVPTAQTMSDARRATRCLLDYERARHGQRALRAISSLGLAAERHARSMAKHHYFGHVDPDGATLADRVRRTSYLHGARRWRLGETIAWSAGRRRTPEAVVASLMRSEAHRAIILTAAFRDLGVGLAAMEGAAATYTADFGVRH